MTKNTSNTVATLAATLDRSSALPVDAGSQRKQRLHAAALCVLAALAPACYASGEPLAADTVDETRAGEEHAAEGDSEENVATAASELYTESSYTYTLPYRGGTGGGPFSIPCPSRHIMVGVYGRGYDYVDQIGPLCAPLGYDGTLGAGVLVGTVGGNGGWYQSRQCPSGHALVGLDTFWGSWVDKVGLRCAPVTTWHQPTASTVFVSGWGGNGGGNWRTDFCANGYFMTSLNGRAGTYIDGLQPVCRYYYP